MNNRIKQIIAPLLITIATSPLYAQTTEQRLEALENELAIIKKKNDSSQSWDKFKHFQLDGYINFTLSQSDQETPYWSDENDELSLNHHSNAGIRLTASMSDKTSAVIQFEVMPDTNTNSDFETGIEWFYLQHHFTEDLSIKAGRLSAPVLNYSEEFEVGFAHPWIRPPEEVYGPLPLNEIDGISLAYEKYSGIYGVRVRGSWGYNHFIFGQADLEQKNIFGLETELYIGDLTLRASRLQMKLNTDLNTQIVISNGQSASPGNPIGSVVNVNIKAVDTDYTLSSAGFTYDNSTIMLTGEYADYTLKEDSPVFANEKGYYLTVGWYIGNFTPYYTYATTKGEDTFLQAGPTPASNIDLAGREQRGQHLGLRFNITDKSALTLEAQYLDNFGDSIGLFGGPAGTLNGVTIDFDSATIVNLAYQAVF